MIGQKSRAKRPAKIGVFDSGLGGLTILAHILQVLPESDVLYVADQAHLPYGGRPVEEVLAFSERITAFLLGEGADLIVVACNTATALAINDLRRNFEAVSFVGVEPAVKPAVQATRSGYIGVLATEATLESARYQDLKRRYGEGCGFVEDPCQGLVEEIEGGDPLSTATKTWLRRLIYSWRATRVDTLVLGCTHFPLIRPLLAELGGPDVKIIDSGPAVAQQTARLLGPRPTCSPDRARQIDLYSTRSGNDLSTYARRVLDGVLDNGTVMAAHDLSSFQTRPAG